MLLNNHTELCSEQPWELSWGSAAAGRLSLASQDSQEKQGCELPLTEEHDPLFFFPSLSLPAHLQGSGFSLQQVRTVLKPESRPCSPELACDAGKDLDLDSGGALGSGHCSPNRINKPFIYLPPMLNGILLLPHGQMLCFCCFFSLRSFCQLCHRRGLGAQKVQS